MVRRLLAMCAVFAVVAGVVGLLNVLLSGGDGADSGPVAGSESVAETSAATTDTAVPTSTDPPTTVKEVTVPSQQNPAELLLVGDSDVGSYGPPLQKLLDPTRIVRTRIEYHSSTGLARPDFYDWMARLRELVPLIDPQLVMVTFGGNDAQGLRLADGTWVVTRNPGQGNDDTAWRAEYGRRVGEVMDYLTENGRRLIWVGIPNDDEDVNTARLAVVEAVVREQAAMRDDVTYFDTWTMFSDKDGKWVESIVDPRDGISKDVRRDDGFHLNDNGSAILAWALDQVVRKELRLMGADI